MKFTWFHLMPYRFLPEDFKDKYRSVWVDIPSTLEVIIQRIKGFATAGRFLWPVPDRGLSGRLYRVKAPTLLLWGEADKIIPPRYAQAFHELLSGSEEVKTVVIPKAGHMPLLEQTQATTKAIFEFCLEWV